jgi:carbon storage regulator
VDEPDPAPRAAAVASPRLTRNHGRIPPMLVLTRQANQSIMIGHDIVVTVLEVRGDHVRIGISAPRTTDVHREEVFRALQKANTDAASPSADALAQLKDLAPPQA